MIAVAPGVGLQEATDRRESNRRPISLSAVAHNERPARGVTDPCAVPQHVVKIEQVLDAGPRIPRDAAVLSQGYPQPVACERRGHGAQMGPIHGGPEVPAVDQHDQRMVRIAVLLPDLIGIRTVRREPTRRFVVVEEAGEDSVLTSLVVSRQSRP